MTEIDYNIFKNCSNELLDIAIYNVQVDINHCCSPSYLQDLSIILKTLYYIKEANQYGKRRDKENSV